MQQIRAFNPRSATLAARGPARESRQRLIRGFDAAGVQLFSTPACTSPRETSRTALDQRTVGERHARYGAKLVRVEIDQMAGGNASFVVRSDGSLVRAFTAGGTTVTFGS